MSDQPLNHHRPDAWATVRVLTAGTMVAVGTFVVGFVLRLVGQEAFADAISTVAVLVLLVTPAAALVTTSIELRRTQRTAALLALLVLVILVGATALALIGR